MLLTEPFFKTFIDKPIVQAKEATEVLVCLSCESREEVDGLVAKAIAAGGRPRVRRRTTASCTATPSKTWTAISGNWRGWRRKDELNKEAS
jgi:hypothetical protein